MICDEIRSVFSDAEFCDLTEVGARVRTHCLYPSFNRVEVFVVKHGEGYIVSDGGGAVASAFLNGREEIDGALSKAASRFCVSDAGGVIEARVPTVKRLKSAILSVANASAYAARAALEKAIDVAEHELVDRISAEISKILPKTEYVKNGLFTGVSGRSRRYDFLIHTHGKIVLINSVSPHSSSIASKYLKFSDLPANDVGISKIAIFGKPLEAHDATLISNVALLMPVSSLSAGLKRVGANG